MASDSPLVDFDAVCQKVRAAFEPNRTHAVSLHDELGDMLWLSESSMGPDEHNAVREAADAFANPAAPPIHTVDLGDSRSAVMVRALSTRRIMVGVVMIIIDSRIVAQGTAKLMNAKLQRALVHFAKMRPDSAAVVPEPPKVTAPAAPAAPRSAPQNHSQSSSTSASARMAIGRASAKSTPVAAVSAGTTLNGSGPRTIAAQLQQIVARAPPRSNGVAAAGPSRPATFVSHVGAARPGAARPGAASAVVAAARPAILDLEPQPEIVQKPAPAAASQKGVPPEIDRLNAALRKSPIVLHVQRLIPLSKGSQMKRFEVLLRSGSEEAPKAAPHAMLKAAVEHGLGSMIDRRVLTELISWLIRHPAVWQAHEMMFSVNLTSTALQDEHFIKFVELCLAKSTLSSLPKGTIAFEVDAPTALTLATKIADVAAALQRLGCPLILDDFSLRTECFELLRLPGVRYVKLSSDITSKMRTDKVAQAAITGVVQMARVLGMHTVAKRTDTAADQEWLTALGVDFVQSHSLSPPMSIDTLSDPYDI